MDKLDSIVTSVIEQFTQRAIKGKAKSGVDLDRTDLDLLDWIEANKDTIYYLPLYLYEHGNITISTSPFSCRWDSGQVGFIYITKEKAEAEGITEPYETLEAETKEYDYYLRGDTYGVRILDSEGEMLDSQFGYIGDRQIAINDAEGMIDTYTH